MSASNVGKLGLHLPPAPKGSLAVPKPAVAVPSAMDKPSTAAAAGDAAASAGIFGSADDSNADEDFFGSIASPQTSVTGNHPFSSEPLILLSVPMQPAGFSFPFSGYACMPLAHPAFCAIKSQQALGV